MIRRMSKEKMTRLNHSQQRHAEKLELTEKKHAAGLLSDKFPNVSNLTVRLTYYGKMTNNVLMIRTVNYFPNSDAYFHMSCLAKECDNGGFEMGPKITKVIKNKKKSDRGEMVCRGKGESLSSDHACVTYEIMVQYKRRGK